MKSVILAAMLSMALASVVVLAGKDLPRTEHENPHSDDAFILLIGN